MTAQGAKITVLVVDDSAFMRRAVSRILEREPDILVIATASCGEEAIEFVEKLDPDVVTMDVEMPGIGGLETVRRLKPKHSSAILMLSALTQQDAETTLHALEYGAVDFIPKPSSPTSEIATIARELVLKVRTFGVRRQNAHKRIEPPAAAPPVPIAGAPFAAPAAPVRCVAIGTSTGGPAALSAIIPKLPANFPAPIIVVQHMPPGFTKPLAERLATTSKLRVVEGSEGLHVKPGMVAIAPAGRMCYVRAVADGAELVLKEDAVGSLHAPSVDVMCASVGEAFGSGALGVILTGMGQDGVEGLRILKSRGGFIVGQDEASCVVYGMPRAAALAGLVGRVATLGEMAAVLCELAGKVPTHITGMPDSRRSPGEPQEHRLDL